MLKFKKNLYFCDSKKCEMAKNLVIVESPAKAKTIEKRAKRQAELEN